MSYTAKKKRKQYQSRTKILLDQPMKQVICFSEIGAKSMQTYKRFEEDDNIQNLAKSERLAVHISKAANLVLFVANVY
ncbi:unnamed protein product, partial [Brassica oleracea var. botrytis]